MKVKLIIDNKELEVEISEDELKKLQEKKKTGYERVKDKLYYWTTGDGVVFSKTDNCSVDECTYEAANYYSDRTVAENNARADKLMRQLRRFAVEHRKEEIDFGNHSQGKHYIVYDYEDAKLYSDWVCLTSRFGSIYFNSQEAANLAIDTFKDELIWYFTEYKDSL